jgi:superfamily II DNA or RNA helicase
MEAHLRGKVIVGIYPLLADETCRLLAADFDKTSWREDALAFLQACDEWNVPASLERSRSGNGGHIWIFFDVPVPAIVARKLGAALLTRAMERRHQIGLDSYDRFFPNQDTMPKGGFGNLIALPLQREARNRGNSVFVGRDLEVFPDQWEYLRTVRLMSAIDVERIVEHAQRKGDVVGVRFSEAGEDADEPDPWTLPPSRRHAELRLTCSLPSELTVVQAGQLFIEKAGVPAPLANRLLRLAAFQNPEFYKAQSMRLSTYGKPRVIACGLDLPRHIAIPRGCLPELQSLLQKHSVRCLVRDERVCGRTIDVVFQGELRPTQEEAVGCILQHDDGVLCAPTAFGKTAVAAWMIAARKNSTLVLVHRQQLLDQWRARLAMFLNLPVDSIGQVGGGRDSRSGVLDVAVIQSLHHQGEVKDFVAEYGHVIIDECHHISAVTFERVMREVKARYVLGLTATPMRKDGHHPIIFMQCGPIRYRMQARAMTESTPFRHVVVPRLTSLQPDAAADVTIQDLYALMVEHAHRNEQIVADVCRAVQAGRCPLVLSGRKEHLDVLGNLLQDKVRHVFVLRGGLGRKQRREVADKIAGVPEADARVILATGSYIGEGFDDPRLDTLFLTMPISWKGTLQQYVGRLHRLHENKRVVQVYDYVDSAVRMLGRMYERRLKGYADIGYEIQTAAQAELEFPTG